MGDTSVKSRLAVRAVCVAILMALSLLQARGEASRVRLSHGYGILYLPLIVMRDQRLLEKHAEQAGLRNLEVDWQVLDGGNVINDAMLAGSLDIAGIGAPGFLTLWAKAHGLPASAITGVSALSAGALWLNTNNPAIRSLRDFSGKDRIAVPGIKTSFAAVVLQMAVAKEFGAEHYAKLDPLTVSLPHPDAVVALLSGGTEITAHFASPPFSYQELQSPKVHRVLSTMDVLGPTTINVVFAPKRFVQANPAITKAFLAAIEEANALIARDKRGAAEIFLRMVKLKLSVDEVEKMLQDPETHFSTAPEGVMQYANFMASAGLIKMRPASWTDLFVPQLHDRNGS
jgi:NitT/TauT family transport system substrate-binding protein